MSQTPHAGARSRAISGIMRGVTGPTVLTDRLVLRLPEPSDDVDALALLRDPEVLRWNPAPAVVDLASAHAWCLSGGDWTGGSHCTWHGVDPSSQRLIVNISIFAIAPEHSSAKVAYRVVPWMRRQGYAREALTAVTDWAFRELGLARLQLEHSVPNTASCRVAHKSGFRWEGTLRSAFRTPDGVRHDDHVHGRLAIDPPG